MRRVAWIVALGLVAGCDAPQTESVKQGLTIVSADTRVGLSGYFVAGKDTVFFESLRQYAPAEGTDERLELAVRLMDAEGRTLMALSEGHMPPTWIGPGTARYGTASVAQKAIKALRAAELDPDFGLEQNIFGQLTASLAGISDEPASEEEIGYGRVWRQRIELYKTCIIDTWFGCLGDHSASRIKRQVSRDGTTWKDRAVWDMCNHGRCPAELKNYMNCNGPTKSAEADLAVANGMCSTSYSWASVFGTHNCNDDTDYQVIMVMGNKTLSTSSGDCDSNDTNNNAISGCKASW